jgi:hypothetical protein
VVLIRVIETLLLEGGVFNIFKNEYRNKLQQQAKASEAMTMQNIEAR